MKKQFLLGISLCFVSAVQAQSTYNVDFNTYVSGSNNDLANNFTGGFALTQQTTNGITGGSVLPTPTVSSNKALYNAHCYVRPSDPNQTSVSISFKYSAAGATSGDNGPEVGFMLTSDSAGSVASGFVTTSISAYPFGGSMISIDGTVNHYTSASFTLVDGHWYQLQLKIRSFNMDSVSASTYVYELGAAGTSTPVLVTSFLSKTEKTVGSTWPHSIFLATLNGGASGGVVSMDNFSVNSYYAPSGIKPVELNGGILISNPATNNLSVITSNKSDIQYAIYNVAGVTLKTGTFNGSTDIDVSSLPSSLYLIRFLAGDNTMVQKFIKE